MKHTTTLVGLLGLFLSSFLLAQNPSVGNPPDWNWIQTIGGASGADRANGVIADGQGNFSVVGDFNGTIKLGTNTFIAEGASNGFLANYTADGTVTWSKQFKSNTPDGRVVVKCVATDPSGNIYVAGDYNLGDLIVDGQIYPLVETTDLFIAKFSATGALLWVRTDNSNLPVQLLVDDTGRAFLLSYGSILAYTNSGSLVWERYFSGSDPIIALKNNTLILAGTFEQHIDLGTYQLDTPATALFKSDIDKITGDFTGAYILATSLTPVYYLRINALVPVTESDFYLSCITFEDLMIGTNSFSTGFNGQYCIAGFESNTNTWAKISTNLNAAQSNADQSQLYLTQAGDLYFTGSCNLELTFENTTLDGSEGGFLAKIDGETGDITPINTQPPFSGGWSDGQSIWQVGSQNFGALIRKTGINGAVLLEKTIENDGGMGTVTCIKQDNSGLYFTTNVIDNTYFLGQQSFHPEPSILITKMNFAGTASIWQQTISGASSVFTFGHALWHDEAKSKLYLIGSFNAPFQFGTQTVGGAEGGVFLAQMGDDGTFGWIKTFPKGVEITSVITDQNGNVLINGNFTDFIQIGNIGLTSAGGIDIFWAKYDSNGNLILAQRMGGEDIDYESYSGVDAEGNFYLCGTYQSVNIDFNGANQVTRADGDGTCFLVRFYANGQTSWVLNLGNTDEPGLEFNFFVSNVAVDPAGNVFLVGLHGTSNFAGPIHLTSPYSLNQFVAKINLTGDVLWANSIKTKRSSFNYCEIGLDENGDCYIGGQYRDSIYFDGTAIPLIGTSGARNAYFAKVNGSDGHFSWVKTLSGSNLALTYPATILAHDPQSILVGGYVSGTVNFDNNSISTFSARVGFLALLGQTITVSTVQPDAHSFILQLTPNPTPGPVAVTVAESGENALLFEVFNADGKLVASQHAQTFVETTNFDLSQQPAGIYFVKVSTAEGQQMVRFVKQ